MPDATLLPPTLDAIVFGLRKHAWLQAQRDRLSRGGLALAGRTISRNPLQDVVHPGSAQQAAGEPIVTPHRRRIVLRQLREATRSRLQRRIVIRALLRGEEPRELAAEYGLSRVTVYRWIRDARRYLLPTE
jgi:DNA-directed RNA polymerase specialized sigma24 family protein